MKTKFVFYDENNNEYNANLIISLEINEKNYIVYEIEDEKDEDLDIMHIGVYKEIDNKPYIYDLEDEEESNMVKTAIDEILENI